MSGYAFSWEPVIVPKVRTENRRINTAIPCPGTKELLSDLAKYESRSMQGQLPVVWDKAEEYSVYDIAGNKWIDFTSTIFVTNVGHANPHVVKSIEDVMNKPLLHTYAYANKYRIEYLKKLIEFTNGDFEKAFLLSAGTEATEAGLKLMRMYGEKKKKNTPGIICIEGNWHGRTLGAQMMSSNKEQKKWIGYQDEFIHYLPFPYEWDLHGKTGKEFFVDSLKKLQSDGIDLEKDVCGIMLETFQGWGAVFYPMDYVVAVKEICIRNNILLAFDEMQAGFGRTGKRFGYEHYQVKPDLICCGKGMASGVPLSGVLSSAEIMDLPETGNMSSTHSANPLVCAAGLATLEELESGELISEAERKGSIFHDKLMQLKIKYPRYISYINGKGLVAAVLFQIPETKTPNSQLASDISLKCMQKGLLVVHTGRESIKLAPPLSISEEAMIEGLEVFEEAIKESI
jgi:4-aminobutyrate aminotransferase / (S)-3-amino-2-methylpropionate transaminase / 5-aminovalerate transaminase